ncbi:MAG TPA: alpha/beta fold hydrolase [Acidimicrobiales bacterium]|jgi:pimeloyl-ACP methyl ester carboxylesterase|nr:alpha/beta fold hydrolase [Acidimicrobiales bacterium]
MSVHDTEAHIVTSDGVELATRSWTSSDDAAAMVVLVHGLSATKDHPHVEALAKMINARGVDVVSYDARGHGESDGYSTLGDLERHDVAAAVQLARSRHARVALVGASMGAIAALAYAQSDPDLAGVVVVSSPGDWRIPLRLRALLTVALTRTGAGRRYSARHARVRIHPVWNPPEPPRAVAPKVVSLVPLAIVHGRRDRLIPFHFSLNVTTEALPEAHAVVVAGMGHAFDPVGHAAICDALEWVLSEAR